MLLLYMWMFDYFLLYVNCFYDATRLIKLDMKVSLIFMILHHYLVFGHLSLEFDPPRTATPI